MPLLRVTGKRLHISLFPVRPGIWPDHRNGCQVGAIAPIVRLEAVEDFPDRLRRMDETENPHAAAAFETLQNIGFKHPFE